MSALLQLDGSRYKFSGIHTCSLSQERVQKCLVLTVCQPGLGSRGMFDQALFKDRVQESVNNFHVRFRPVLEEF